MTIESKHVSTAYFAASILFAATMGFSHPEYRILGIASLPLAGFFIFKTSKRGDKLLFLVSYLVVSLYSLAIGIIYSPPGREWGTMLLAAIPVTLFVAIRLMVSDADAA